MSIIKIKSLNENAYIYESESGLLLAEQNYDEEKVNNMKKRYYTVYNGMDEAEFLNEKDSVQIRSLCLVLTNQCNFRCRYCINSDMYQYSKGYDNSCMSYDIIDLALEFYYKNYVDCMEINPNTKFVVLFYGGEPLLQMDKIKYVVEKVEKFYNITDATYGITTNGFLIDREIISYFSKHNFFVHVSLDGYEEIHDLNRVTIDGKPTHKVVINNIKSTLDLLPVERYGILLTLDYQVSPLKLNQFFVDNPDLDMRINRINVVSGYNTNYYYNTPEYTMYMQEVDELFEQYLKGEDVTNFINKFFESKFIRFEKRIHFSDVTCSICNPLSSKLTIATDGSCHICEKINENYNIGNICEGLDRKKALQYYKNLMQLKKNHCSNCEVNGICNVCYAMINGDGNSFEISEKFCDNQKQDIKHWLKYYCTTLEKI